MALQRQSANFGSSRGVVPEPDSIWFERFRDITKASAQVLENQDSKGKSSFLVKLELSGPAEAGVGAPAETLVRTTLTFDVEERDLPGVLRLLGRRVLYRELRTRASVEKEALMAEVQRLQDELQNSLAREEALRSNLHIVIEGTRKLPGS